MLGISFYELLLTAIIFLVVVNPKHYPTILYWIGVRCAELKELSQNLKKSMQDSINPENE